MSIITMSHAFFVVLSVSLLPLAVLAYLLLPRSPIGYQDRTGFHYGRRPPTSADRNNLNGTSHENLPLTSGQESKSVDLGLITRAEFIRAHGHSIPRCSPGTPAAGTNFRKEKPEAKVGSSSGNPHTTNPTNPEGKPESNIGERNSTGCGVRSQFQP